MKDFKVLLVDDEREFIEALSERLKMRDMDAKLALDGEQALRLGVYAYLQKPVDLERLVMTLRDAVRNKVPRKNESSLMAATFAEAGDVKTARQITDGEEDPMSAKKKGGEMSYNV